MTEREIFLEALTLASDGSLGAIWTKDQTLLFDLVNGQIKLRLLSFKPASVESGPMMLLL